MKKHLLYTFLISIFAGIGTGFFVSTELLSVWSSSEVRGLVILVGAVSFSSLLYYFLIQFLGKNRINELPTQTYNLILLLLIVFAGFIVLAFPLPQRMTPDQIQTIVFQPEQDSSTKEIKSVLIEEVRLNGKPVVLSDFTPPSGWEKTSYGIESKTGSSIPFVIQKQEDLVSGVSILLGKGPAYGQATIRLGWNQQQINLFQPNHDAEITIHFPSNSDNIPWKFLYIGSVWLFLIGIFYLFISIFIPKGTLLFIVDSFIQKSNSILFWIVISFLFWYSISFIQNVFFDPSHMMQNGNFLPAIRPIGNDLNLILKAGHNVLSGNSPYEGANKYPPLATLIFLPLSIINKIAAYQIITVISYLFYGFITLYFPFLLSKSKKLPTYAWFLFAVGLYSYGLLFEIERGQFNLIAIGCAFIAILIFHQSPRFRWLSYLLLTISIQLKLYPAIFILFFIDDWKNWGKIFLRWIGLGITNFILLFILGVNTGLQYIFSMSDVVLTTGDRYWPLSHSIQSFLDFVNYYFIFPSEIKHVILIFIQICVLVQIGLCFYQAYRRKDFLDPYLLLACALAALTIPPLSNDYTLSYLVGPVIYLFIRWENKQAQNRENQTNAINFNTVIIGLLALCLTSTFFSYLQKPILLQNQFPALFIMLVCSTILSANDPSGKTKTVISQESQ
ncbi:MAG TPA: glycosyltransferase family 87 protein [Leptolinea sp.]